MNFRMKVYCYFDSYSFDVINGYGHYLELDYFIMTVTNVSFNSIHSSHFLSAQHGFDEPVCFVAFWGEC